MTTRRHALGILAGAAVFGPFVSTRALAADEPTLEAAQAASARAFDALVAVPDLTMHGSEVIAMLLYPGFTALDLVGPQYFFASMLGATVHLVTNQPDLTPVKSDLGLAITPTVTMADCPADLTVLFVPGGSNGTCNAMEDPATLLFLADRGARAGFVTSVCTGSLLLAAAGLLRGKHATSHWALREALVDFGAIGVDERVVTDGNIVTAAGVSAGLDLAVTMVERMRGRPYAATLMLQAEYAPAPPFAGGTVASTDAAIAMPFADVYAPMVYRSRAIAQRLRQGAVN
jgi:putative intracellular protease/amidase